jgi:hypothetical protein
LDIKEKAKSQLKALERLIHSLPGFKGYYEREMRRDSDHVHRQFIADKMKNLKDDMQKVIRVVAREKRLDVLTEYDEVLRGIDKFINEVTYANRGYSGFFDLIKIGEAELEAIYQFDIQIIEDIEEFVRKFDLLSTDPLNISQVRLFRNYLDQIESVFRNRNAILNKWQ